MILFNFPAPGIQDPSFGHTVGFSLFKMALEPWHTECLFSFSFHSEHFRRLVHELRLYKNGWRFSQFCWWVVMRLQYLETPCFMSGETQDVALLHWEEISSKKVNVVISTLRQYKIDRYICSASSAMCLCKHTSLNLEMLIDHWKRDKSLQRNFFWQNVVF